MSINLNLCKVNSFINNEIKKVSKFSDKVINNKYEKIIKGDKIKKLKTELKILYEYHKIETEKKEKLKILKSLSKKKIKFSLTSIVSGIDIIKGLGYRLLKEIGEGAFGTVYLCEKNKKKFAIKLQFYFKEDGNMEGFIKSRLNEYKIAKKIGNAGIGPKIYETMFFYDEIKELFLNIMIMEYIKGEELCSYQKKLKESEIKKLKLKIDKLHKMKIYHKDLHRCNIMVTKKNGKLDFVILDFGMAVEQKNIIKNLKKNNKGRAFMIYYDEEMDKVLFISIYNLLNSKKIIVNC